MFSQEHQAWRKHPMLQGGYNARRMFPGLGTAAAIFGTYVFLEKMYDRYLENQAVAQRKLAMVSREKVEQQ